MTEKRCAGGVSRLGLTLLASVFILVSVSYYPVAAAGEGPIAIQVGISGSGSYSETLYAPFTWEYVYAHPDDVIPWDPVEQTIDLGGGNLVTFDLYFEIKADPYLRLNFAVGAGESDTHFTFSTDVLTFAPLTVTSDYASVSAYIGGPYDTIKTGGFPPPLGGKAYRALYNGSQIYADLINTPVSYPGTSDLVNNLLYGQQVSSMQAKWDFYVSAYGSATGLSQYQIRGEAIPEPASMLLLGLGGLALLRKRRA